MILHVEYWAKVMVLIIDKYCKNRDISANFNEILFEMKYHAIFRDIYRSKLRGDFQKRPKK